MWRIVQSQQVRTPAQSGWCAAPAAAATFTDLLRPGQMRRHDMDVGKMRHTLEKKRYLASRPCQQFLQLPDPPNPNPPVLEPVHVAGHPGVSVCVVRCPHCSMHAPRRFRPRHRRCCASVTRPPQRGFAGCILKHGAIHSGASRTRTRGDSGHPAPPSCILPR